MESLNWHTREGLAHTLARRTGFPHEPAVIAATIKNPVIEHERTPSACKPDVNRNSTSVVKEEGLAHQKNERPGQEPERSSVEVLTSYSHTVRAADLLLCIRKTMDLK